MPITINGSGTISGISTGGLPDGIVDADTLSSDALDGIDLITLRNDISTLALHSAVADNRAAYNLPNSFIDQFEDDTGIGTETDIDRDAGEYISSTTTGDLNTLLLCHFDGNLTDETGTHTVTAVGNATTSTVDKKFGTHSLLLDGSGDYATIPDHADFDWGTSDFTIESWFRPSSSPGGYRVPTWIQSQGGNPGTNNNIMFQFDTGGTGGGIYVHGDSGSGETNVSGTTGINMSGWNHIVIQKTNTNNLAFYINGSRKAQASHANYNALGGGSTLTSTIGAFGGTSYSSSTTFHGYIDDLRISNIARYGSNNPATITVPTAAHPNPVILNATGTLISTAQTANAAQTKVSGVVLYKNNTGTATLGTDLKVYFTCNGGTNWTESTPVAAGTFSSGILMAKCPEVTCTSGTDIRYKAVWANQASGTKETQLHGVGMNY